LDREPTPDEVLEQIEDIFFHECDGFVFCGYGEPTCRFEALIEIAKRLKEKYPNIPIRLNTNGQSELINGKNSTKKLFGLIDSVSISLNASNENTYDKICRSVFGKKAYDAIIYFMSHCRGNIPNLQFSVVEETLSDDEIEICRKTAERLGVKIRIRKFISDNDKNPE
jgi:TatD family-associated radical SAM protein